jgi:hypothetical protein
MPKRIGFWKATELLGSGIEAASAVSDATTEASEPILAALKFLVIAACEGCCTVFGRRGHNAMWEPIPAADWPSLTIDPIAGKSDNELEEYSEAQAHPREIGPDYHANVWSNLRWERDEIEALRLSFEHWFRDGAKAVDLDQPVTPYETHSMAGSRERTQASEAEANRILESNPLPYAEAVKIVGAVVIGPDWKANQAEDFLWRKGLVTEFRGKRYVERDALRTALSPHWNSAAEPVAATTVLLHDAVALLESRHVSKPAEALLHALQSGRIRADGRYKRRDGKTATGALHREWWHHVARFGEGELRFDAAIVWFGNDLCAPQTPIRAWHVAVARDEIDRVWPEPTLRTDVQRFPGGITWVDREYDLRLREVLEPANARVPETRSDRPRRKGPPKQERINHWMRQRVNTWPADAAPPTEEDDLKAARDAGLGDVRREQIRKARSNIAPEDWRKRGPRTIPPDNSA